MMAQAQQAATRPILTAAEPPLFVADIKRSCDFFTGKLGSSVAFVYGDPPFYAQVRRDRAALNLRCVHDPVFDGARREREHLLSAAITIVFESFADREPQSLDRRAATVPPLLVSPRGPPLPWRGSRRALRAWRAQHGATGRAAA